ncbi:Lrp/AsnC family transcriptional regulator [Corynebacterium ulceribovis]|uniref:Lrp/AsnC family transcriptional regulator n=1 Tax=Corynebacterium ulceribovis TaxID=487732 RepID=UPI0003721FFF|nr:Lrp/AsnC family transcriptional regulator [Corynebacterium ulceribovis]
MDKIDYAIIAELQRDARQSNQELARKVGLTPAPCMRRVRKLEKDGVVTGYTALINPDALDRGFEVIIEVNLSNNAKPIVDAFERRVATLPEVVEARRMFGQPDYIVRIQMKNLEEYQQWLVDRLMAIPGVSRVDSRMTMKVIKASGAQ